MTRKEINPDFWTYEKDGDFIDGVLVNVQKDVGENKSMLYTIENAKGITNVWGSTILDQRMALVKIGEHVWITYKGLTEKKGAKNPAKIFKVEVDRD